MVLVQSAPQPTAPRGFMSRIHPNPARVLGVAIAIALNAALFMLLLAPMGTDLPPPAQDDLIAFQIFEPAEPPPPPPPVTATVTPPTPAPTPVRRETVVDPVEPPPVVVDQGGLMDLPVPPTTETASTATAAATLSTAPIAGVRLEYASAPAPSYPRRPLADRIEGQVLLQVLVDVDGKPLEVSIHRSSGNRELDRTAQQHVLRHWSFRPAMKDGRAVKAIGLVPIDFKLQ